MAKAASSEAVELSNTEPMTIEELNSLFGTEDSFVPDTYEDLNDYFEAQGGLITFKGSDYDLVKDKRALVDKPFAIINIRFYEGKFGKACAVMALTEDNEKIVFNDGSSGVFTQCLRMVQVAGRRGGFLCPNGLLASDYTYEPKDLDGNSLVGKVNTLTGEIFEATPATTYYVG